MDENATADAAIDAQLRDIAAHKFPATRDTEQRIDVYLELNQLLRIEDSPASVRALCREAPALLREFQYDLQRTTVRDVLHVCLRTLSYFLYHRALVAAFSDAQLSTVLSGIVSLLCSTQDETTYKLCLWSLAMQNTDARRQSFVERTVEAFVQAIANPFKSRAIELQALKALHLLLLKHSTIVAASDTAVQIWLEPVCSRLTSSHEETRELARIVLTAASTSTATWSPQLRDALRDCLVQYAFAAMETHMTKHRNRDALTLWRLTLTLLQAARATDASVLNAMMYVPEQSMRHRDASVRLVSIEAWSALVGVFRATTSEWFWKKTIVQLLIAPIVVCLRDERLLNIVHAAFVTWRMTVRALVYDFNRLCRTHECVGADALQATARKWMRWFDEAISKPLAAAMTRSDGLGGSSSSARMQEEQQFFTFAAALWAVRSDEESEVVAAAPRADVDASSITISTSLFGLASILPDVLRLLEQLLQHVDATATALDSDPWQTFASIDAMWTGVCERLRPTDEQPPVMQKLRRRLLRVCLEFAFGVPNSSSTTTTTSTTSRINDAQAFSIRWQLRLLRVLLDRSDAASPQEFSALFAHPKSALLAALSGRMEWMNAQHATHAQLLAVWSSPSLADEADDDSIDFAARTSVLPCTLLYVLLAFATLLECDDSSNDGDDLRVDVDALRAVVASVTQCLIAAGGAVPTRHEQLACSVARAIERCDALLTADVPTDRTLLCDALLRVSSASSAPNVVDLNDSTGVIDVTSSASTLSSNDELTASADASVPSPCMLEIGAAAAARAPVQSDNDERHEARPPQQQRCIFSSLRDSTAPIAQLESHLPQALRPLLSCHSIATVGDLSAMSIDAVEALGISDPVAIVTQALTAFSSQTTALERRSSSASTSSPPSSRRRILKRASDLSKVIVSSAFPLTNPQHRKRVRRSLLDLTLALDDLDDDDDDVGGVHARSGARTANERSSNEANGATSPKIASRVTFCLRTTDGEIRMTRPGQDDSQDTSTTDDTLLQSSESADDQRRVEKLARDLVQHLQQSAVAVDTLVAATHDRLPRGARTSTASSTVRIQTQLHDVHTALDAVTSMHQQLEHLVELYSRPRDDVDER